MKLKDLIKQMNSTDQLSNKITVLQHGQMVKERLWDLLSLLNGGKSSLVWSLPDEILKNKKFLLAQLPSRSTLYLYTVLHDCGKPFCVSKDEKG